MAREDMPQACSAIALPKTAPRDTPVPQGYRDFVRAWDDRHDALAASEQALAALA